MQPAWHFLLASLAFPVLSHTSPVDWQPPAIPSFNNSHARSAIITLQQWYNETTGLWESTGWWNSANALTVLADYVAVDPSFNPVAMHVFENTFSKAQKASLMTVKVKTSSSVNTYTGPMFLPMSVTPRSEHAGFLNSFYDDEGWWALAWLQVYDVTNQQQYLQAAMNIFEDMTKGWSDTCGGLWWNKKHSHIAAIENSLFLTVAAKLTNRASNQDFYLGWARKEWDWFQRTGMINEHYNINDGIDLKTCRNNNDTVWSYNQGVILGGLLELHQVTPNQTLLAMAERIALAGIKKLSDSHGILHEPCEPNCGNDGPQFKGIFLRNLQKLQLAIPNDRIKRFINVNAHSIWHNGRSASNQLGLNWSGPFKGATASTQSSATDALVAALAIGQQRHNLSIPTPPAYAQVMKKRIRNASLL